MLHFVLQRKTAETNKSKKKKRAKKKRVKEIA